MNHLFQILQISIDKSITKIKPNLGCKIPQPIYKPVTKTSLPNAEVVEIIKKKKRIFFIDLNDKFKISPFLNQTKLSLFFYLNNHDESSGSQPTKSHLGFWSLLKECIPFHYLIQSLNDVPELTLGKQQKQSPPSKLFFEWDNPTNSKMKKMHLTIRGDQKTIRSFNVPGNKIRGAMTFHNIVYTNSH